MKRQIRPYFKHALRENALYLVLIVLLIIFSIGFVLIAPGVYSDNIKKAAQLEADVKDLRLKKSILDSSVAGNPENVEESVAVMNKLIPETEDYFSVIAALEELSQKTSFIITSYVVDVQNSQADKLALNVTGVGDEQSFINFLQQYNFEGERLITIEDISLGEEETGSFSLVLNFYSQPADSVGNSGLDYQGALQTVNEIRNKVNFNLQPMGKEQSSKTIDYEKKTNPF